MIKTSEKFNRFYVLSVQYGEKLIKNGDKIEFKPGDKQVVINPFFTIKFTVDRGIFATQNKFSIDIYNLSQRTREALYYDSILLGAVSKEINFFCGYAPTINSLNIFKEGVIHQDFDVGFKQKNFGVPLIFSGRMTRCYSYRKGVDFVTHIEGFDLPDKNEININAIFDKGSSHLKVIEAVAKELNIKSTNVFVSGYFNFNLKRAKTFSNVNAWKVLDTMVASVNADIVKEQGANAPQFRLFYDMNNLFILRDDEGIPDNIVEISAETGLLDTPIREYYKCTFTSLFEPQFRCGGWINLQSRTADPNRTGIQGLLKVVGFTHSGTVSPVVCGSLTTKFTCYLGLAQLETAQWQSMNF